MSAPEMNHNIPKILFVAGGTGGHINPALAVSQALHEINGRVETKFICGSRDVEVSIYRNQGIHPVILDIDSMGSGIPGRAIASLRLLKCILKARRFLKRWRPDRIVGQGGYIIAPVIAAARNLGIPYDLQEQNSVPGKANRFFGKRAERIFCSFEEAVDELRSSGCRSEYTGMPLRKEALVDRSLSNRKKAREKRGLHPDWITLLIMGGSQGARGMNECVLKTLEELDHNEMTPPFQCLWSVGEKNMEELNRRLRQCNLKRIGVKVEPYIRDVVSAFEAADVAVSRAGACSVWEITANHIPAIFIPLPGSKDNHQEKNARKAERTGSAVLMSQQEATDGRLTEVLSQMVDSDFIRKKMARAAVSFNNKNSAEIIAKKILEKLEK